MLLAAWSITSFVTFKHQSIVCLIGCYYKFWRTLSNRKSRCLLRSGVWVSSNLPEMPLWSLYSGVCCSALVSIALDTNCLWALIWDILSSIPKDHWLIQTGNFSIVLCAWPSKISRSFFFDLPDILRDQFLLQWYWVLCRKVCISQPLYSSWNESYTILSSAGISNCGVATMILVAFQVLFSAASSYPFLKRVYAVQVQHRQTCF